MTASFNPSGFNALLMGDESLTIACGDMVLAGGHRIAAVITRDAAVASWAGEQGVKVVSQATDVVGFTGIDWLLSIANLRMIPDAVLAVPARGAVNFHDGPLPRYAGLNTPAWAIINGETQHGVSWHMIEGGVDEGDLLAQATVEIAPDEIAFSLNSKCYAAGMESFPAVLAQLEAGKLERAPQDLSLRSYFARDGRPQTVVDFAQPTAVVSALLRGVDFGAYWNPLGLAKIVVDGNWYAVKMAAVSEQTGPAGSVLDVSERQLTVATADGAVTLVDLRDASGAAVAPSDVVQVGTVLAPVSHPDAQVLAKQEGHWRGRLQGMEPLDLALAHPPKGEERSQLALNTGTLKAEDILTSAALILLRGTGQEQGDVAYGTDGDPSPFVADWVPLNIAADGDMPLSQAAEQLATQVARAQTSAGFSADLPLRDPDIALATCPAIGITTSDRAIAGAALTVVITDAGARLDYDTAALSTDAANLLAARLNAGFAAFASASTCAELWALPAAEHVQVVEAWNKTDAPYDRSATIPTAFEAQVSASPDATALVFEDQTLTYDALNRRANQLAHVLRDMGATAGTPIGLATTRSLDLLVGALGILKAGGAYVPLDPAYPADRIAHYIADSGAPIIVAQSHIAQGLPAGDAQMLHIDSDPRLADAPQENPAQAAGAADLAYLIYTSGSTGTPKGVMVTHGNVINFFTGMDGRIDHAAGAVWLAVTSLSFDISVLELFWTLSRGFKLLLAGDDMRMLDSKGVISASDRQIDFNLMYWGNDDGVGPKKYELLLEGAKFADANGLNAVWTPERHFHAFGGPYPNPSVTGAAVAAVTQNLAVRAGSCVAPLHHPARIAEEWAVIDNMTNGRVGLAIASGWQPDDFVLRPENTPPQNKPAMYETIKTLRRLWAGEAVAFPKQDGTEHAVVTQPRPVSTELPLWVTTAGNPATWKEAGEIGANVLTHLLGQSIQEVADKIKIYHAALREAGHDPADFTVTVMLHTYLADTREEAEAVAREPMKDYLRAAAGLIKQYAWAFPAFKKPEGATSAFDVNLEGLDAEEMDAILEFAFQRYFNDSGLFGTVADGVARAEQLKAIGVDEIACLIDYGIATDKVMAGLEPVAEVLRRANAGGGVEPGDFSLPAQIVRHGVTHMQCTPSMAQMMVSNDNARAGLARLQHLLVGGEALPASLVKSLHSVSPAKLQNMYGPTETTIWSTSQNITGPVTETAPIGTPIANTQVYVLDADHKPMPIGAAGALWIAGDGVTQGYWQRDAMTAERFVPNPFGAGRMYNTGDLAAWQADGTLAFMGRADAQVKIRGHRIELGEIEARLAEQPGVREAVVVLRTGQGGDQLAGYVTTDQALNVAAMQTALSQVLPDIMVPSAIVALDAMPLTPNKKVDRKALPAPVVRTAAPTRDVAVSPVEGTQAGIAAIWSGLLGVADIRGEDNFFALGGHSLLAVQAHRDIKQSLGAEKLSITDIFRFPTLEGLAGHVDALSGAGAPATASAPVAEPVADKSATMSKRRMMRAGRGRAGSS